MSIAADDPRHGTQNGYNNLRCRCSECREAWRVYYASKNYNYKYRTESGLLRNRYRAARDAGYSSYEATRRSHWSDPLAVVPSGVPQEPKT